MAEIEAFLVAFGAPGGLALWILWQSRQQAKSGDGTSLSAKIDAIKDDVSKVRERVAKIEGILTGRAPD